jgi:hypothetical protein
VDKARRFLERVGGFGRIDRQQPRSQDRGHGHGAHRLEALARLGLLGRGSGRGLLRPLRPETLGTLLRAGRSGGRTWVISWHPNGASHRGVGPRAYADIIVNAVAKAESQNNRELEDAIG